MFYKSCHPEICAENYRRISNISAPTLQTEMSLVWSCSCLSLIHWSQILGREWRCNWSSADRRCSNYIWVINNFIPYLGATYIRGLTVGPYWWLGCLRCHMIWNILQILGRTCSSFVLRGISITCPCLVQEYDRKCTYRLCSKRVNIGLNQKIKHIYSIA